MKRIALRLMIESIPCAKCGLPIKDRWYKDSCSFDRYHPECYELPPDQVMWIEECAEMKREDWEKLRTIRWPDFPRSK